MTFLRPWFLLLLFIPLIMVLFNRHRGQFGNLSFIDKKLLPFVTVQFSAKKSNGYRVLLGVLWGLFVLAGSGPAFHKESMPTIVSAPSSVIVADILSAHTHAEMLGLQVKINDLLTIFHGRQVGLVLFDEKGYVASPITQDLQIIRNMVSVMDASVMPGRYANAIQGINKAQTLLENSKVREGQIILITFSDFETSIIKKLAKDLHYQLVILTPNVSLFQSIQSRKVHIVEMDTLGKDMLKILSLAPADKDSQNKSDVQIEFWTDSGIYLLICAIPLFFILSRKGLLVLFFCLITVQTNAGLFQRADQMRFSQIQQGINAYHGGNYQKAQQIFAEGATAVDYYNLGNALAQSGDIKGAIDSYNQAIQLTPDFAEAIYNKEYLETLLPPPETDPVSQPESEETTPPETTEEQPQTTENQEPRLDSTEQPETTEQNETEIVQNAMDSEQTDVSTEESMTQTDTDAEGSEDRTNTKLEETAEQTDVAAEESAEATNSANHEPSTDTGLETTLVSTEDVNGVEWTAPAKDSDDNTQSQEQTEITETEDEPYDEQEDINNLEGAGFEQPEKPDFSEYMQDQETMLLLNKVKQDDGYLLRMRLQQQYMEQR